MNFKDKPLSGFRVLELSNYVAAPSCGRILADWGADVIKVDSPAGDIFRYYGQVMDMPASEEENPLWDLLNSNKRGMTIDLKSVEGKELFFKLLGKADVFLTNSQPAILKKFDLDYENLKDIFPQLVYALLTGYGEKGPDADLPGFDVASYNARSGLLIDLVKPGEYPIYSPAGFGDISVGTTLFGAICAALLNRGKTGKGDKISISLYGTAVWFTSVLTLCTQERYGNKYPKSRMEGNPLAMPYKCKDSEWIILSLINIEKQWSAFCNSINRKELVSDPRFRTRTDLLNHKTELIPILEEVFSFKDSGEWLKILRNNGLVAEKLVHFKDVSKDPQAWANDFFVNHTFANGKEAALACPPFKSERKGMTDFYRGPLLGEHTKEIMGELGYSHEEIDEMEKNKSIITRGV